MNEHNEQMKSVRHFWANNKEECCLIRSIDAVYDVYTNYHTTYENPADGKYKFQALNRYKFRAFIRKNGYNNSGTEMIPPSVKKEIKDKEKIERVEKQLEKIEQIENMDNLTEKEYKKKQKLLKNFVKLEKKTKDEVKQIKQENKENKETESIV